MDLFIVTWNYNSSYNSLYYSSTIATQKKFLTFWGVKFMMMLPMLERLKQSLASGLITIKVNLDLQKKKDCRKGIGDWEVSLFESCEMENTNLKKENVFGNKNWNHFNHLVLIKKKNIYFNHTQYIRSLGFIYLLRQNFSFSNHF